MSNIINFMEKVRGMEEMVYECSRDGCINATFFIHEDGAVECARCHHYPENHEELNLEVRKWMKNTTTDKPEADKKGWLCRLLRRVKK